MDDENEISELMAKITLQGNKVRDLKAVGADKTKIDEEVNVLLALKSELATKHPESSTSKNPETENKANKGEKGKSNDKDERAAKKEARRLARLQQQSKGKDASNDAAEGEESMQIPLVSAANVLVDTFGDLILQQSSPSDKLGRNFVTVKSLNLKTLDALNDLHKATDTGFNVKGTIWLRAFVHTTRAQSKMAFVLLREGVFTVQAVVGDKKIAKFVAKIPNESVIDVCGKLVAVKIPTKATQSDVEIQVERLFVVSRASQQLAFQVIDANRSEKEIQQLEQQALESQKDGTAAPIFSRVGLDTRLDNRHLDIRTQCMQATVRISSCIGAAFRSFLLDRDFVEIQTPKLLGGSSEGGAEVFKCDYFGIPGGATLAQSPQLHKQIMAACAGVGRVFECAPVFRAENSNTNRHLCEFQGFDLEMCFKEHYHEVLDLFSDMFHFIFNSINQKMQREIEIVKEFYPFEDLVYSAPEWIEKEKICGVQSRTLRIEFSDAIKLLRAAGVDANEQGDYEDLSTPVEKKLGALVKEKYGVDFYFLDKFPLKPRPFYTMPCPINPKLSNSYDFFIRGQEIMSGAQRVHDAAMLEKRILEKGVDPASLRFYIDSFKAGAMPHAGGGVGLERVVMLFLALPNIRLARMFPRDPMRLMP